MGWSWRRSSPGAITRPWRAEALAAKGEPRSVAVVIPSWNSLDLLRRCLGSLVNQSVDLELLVVDNGSSDGSLAYLEAEGVPHVSLPQNAGFAAAVNLGVRRVASSAIFVLNADTVLEPGCVDRLLNALRADPSLGGVQPRILQLEAEAGPPAAHRPGSIDTARLYSAGQALTADGRALELGAGEDQGTEHVERREVFGVCGAACLLRRELFTELGGYDERYFAFYEDVDLNVRARIASWRFEYVPEAVVWHVGNVSWQRGFDRPAADNARLVARNRLATQVKFMPLGSVPRITAVEAGALLRAFRQRRLLVTLRGKLSALRWLPRLLRNRRLLGQTGDISRARAWLGR
jgi:N-acetylglucosaminyl-diphospho-decaprenol L-rhamnosyltransferase